MSVNLEVVDKLINELKPYNATLVAVSKTKPVEDILDVFNHGHDIFGENYVQELISKQAVLPETLNWHFIGHLQSNKAKLITPFVKLIHGVESLKLANEISKQGEKIDRKIDILLQIHIAREETKFGFDKSELLSILDGLSMDSLPYVRIRGLMGMASFSDDTSQVRSEFKMLKQIYDQAQSQLRNEIKQDFDILSMGMSGDYKIALEEGSNMVRIGSAIFGSR
jgi:pyridoxal phosphate enzyme (YggS family)